MIEFEKPNITVVEQEDSYGKFVVEPLERGFGTTLGNSLRRVYLLLFRVLDLFMCKLMAFYTSSQQFLASEKM